MKHQDKEMFVARLSLCETWQSQHFQKWAKTYRSILMGQELSLKGWFAGDQNVVSELERFYSGFSGQPWTLCACIEKTDMVIWKGSLSLACRMSVHSGMIRRHLERRFTIDELLIMGAYLTSCCLGETSKIPTRKIGHGCLKIITQY